MLSLHTVLSVQPVINELLMGVKVVEHRVRVRPVTGREDNHLKMTMGELQAFQRHWPNIDSRLGYYSILTLLSPTPGIVT